MMEGLHTGPRDDTDQSQAGSQTRRLAPGWVDSFRQDENDYIDHYPLLVIVTFSMILKLFFLVQLINMALFKFKYFWLHAMSALSLSTGFNVYRTTKL
jgi:hypothetical protein